MSARSDEEWLHELRNAINASCAAVEVAYRSLQSAQPERALEFLADAGKACARCRDLLRAAAEHGCPEE